MSTPSAASIYEASPSIPSQELLDRNAKYMETHTPRVDAAVWDNFPKTAIITCLDSRVHPHKQLGLADHDVTMIRNAAGLVYEILQSILIAQHWGTRHFVLIKHSDCGGFHIVPDGFIENLKAHAKDPNAVESAQLTIHRGFGTATIEQVVQGDVEYLRKHPLLFKETKISGWVFEDDTGKIRQVA
ncbi:hypothetical protein D9758_015047 [Tetrapyrgos nigripes]|uniref:Carbonic anhydrase n=1 Tax=Tetrapyrgos nigripes TaxID=182062 RepID=A0A8H5CPJ6_9AGAR|nr:hypothetical protein D9758_013080 [Tetrapyrgos nigripes]KAF5347478.1 hypothetical protein D9758_015047 [Tetrapyrgos nigripes]